jgi:GDP/UDP-N,N'-diacetylbacillosamine 2-epimerase (hydrolysing)
MGIYKKINIGIFTTSRSEFGIMRPFIHQLKKNKKFNIMLFVGGSHLNTQYGKTVNEIYKSKIKIKDFFFYKQNKTKNLDISYSLSDANLKLAKLFSNYNFKYLIIFGDRLDLIPIISNSIIYKKKIIHVGGGETTLGAIDNTIRNLVSCASNIHFTCHDQYSNKLKKLNIRQNVYNVGSLSVDAIKSLKIKLNKNEICKKLNLDVNLPIVSMTYHPATNENGISIRKKLNNIFKALNKFNFNLVITGSNFEEGSEIVEKIIYEQIQKKKNYKYIKSLGFDNYQNLIANSDFLIGNSSSGIMEAPYYKVPSINVGSRQQGRVKHISVVDTKTDVVSIVSSINLVLLRKFKNKIKNMKYNFGSGNSANKKISILKKILK